MTAPARHRYITGRSLLRDVLSSYLAVTPRDIEFMYSGRGKPGLVGGKLQFSLSHSGSIVACAFTGRPTVGLDIEHLSSAARASAIGDHFLTEEEMQWIGTLEPSDRPAAILQSWVRKEAVVKGTGDGLGIPLERVFTPPRRHLAGSQVRVEGRRSKWFVWDLRLTSQHAASLASSSKRVSIRHHAWNPVWAGRVGENVA